MRGGGKGSAGQGVRHTELAGSRKGHLGCAAVAIVTRALRPQGDAAAPAPILPTLCGPTWRSSNVGDGEGERNTVLRGRSPG